MKYVCCVVLLFCLFGGDSAVLKAQDSRTGADLLAQCQVANKTNPDTNDTLIGILCPTYLKGMSVTFTIWKAFNEERKQNNPPPVCIPAEVTGRELALVIVKYLNDNPTLLHEPYGVVAFKALATSYPCK